MTCIYLWTFSKTFEAFIFFPLKFTNFQGFGGAMGTVLILETLSPVSLVQILIKFNIILLQSKCLQNFFSFFMEHVWFGYANEHDEVLNMLIVL